MIQQASSCIAVFIRYRDAKQAIDRLLDVGVDAKSISLIGEHVQEGLVAAQGLKMLDDELPLLGVQEANLHCYKCLVFGGFFLVIVSGNHTQVDHACSHLEKTKHADVSLHFNAPPQPARL